MADSGFSLKKLFSWLDGFLKSMSSPMSGWDMADVKVKQEGDNFSSYFSFVNDTPVKDTRTGEQITNFKGDKIELAVLLKAINAQTVLSPIMSGLNNMSVDSGDIKENKALLDVLFGTETESNNNQSTEEQSDDNQHSEEQPTDEQANGEQTSEDQTNLDSTNSSIGISGGLQSIFATDFTRGDSAKKNGTGLLGVDLEKLDDLGDIPDEGGMYNGQMWSWAKIAFNYLHYAIECQVPGKNYGAIENVTLNDCSALISEYLVHEDCVADASEVKVNSATLVLPILCRMQAMLAEYFENAYKNNPGIQKVQDTDTSEQDAAEAQAKADAEKAQQEESERQQQQMNDQFFSNVDNQNQPYRPGASSSQAQQYFPTASKHIGIKLKKIQGSIDLLALQSNYSPTETLDDLEDVIYQDEFIDNLTENPQSFNISVDDDGYDIEQCEDCEIDPCSSLNSVMNTAIVMYRNLYILHWMAKGNDMMKLHLLTEDLYSELIQEIDTLGELLVEKCGTVQNLDFEWTPIAVRNYEFQESLVILKDFIQNYIDTIDYAYPNQTSDVQSTLDEWLRYWNKQMNYFIKNQEM